MRETGVSQRLEMLGLNPFETGGQGFRDETARSRRAREKSVKGKQVNELNQKDGEEKERLIKVERASWPSVMQRGQ